MIGIMSDSHDNLIKIREAVNLFKDAGCSLVIHAGDVVAPFAAQELSSLNCPVKAVFGNCDGEKKGLEKVFLPFGEIRKAPLAFSHIGLNIVVIHLNTSIESYAKSPEHDVVIFGHSHKPEIRMGKRSLLINPGETGGWLSGKSTVVLLDPITLEAEIVVL
jgi:putative phosphoesterase